MLDRTTQVFYSSGSEALAAVSEVVSNDVSGQGQYHFGILKKPTGEGITDPSHQGYQPAGIEEAVTFGGIFQEDSSSGCVSTSGSAGTATAASTTSAGMPGSGGNATAPAASGVSPPKSAGNATESATPKKQKSKQHYKFANKFKSTKQEKARD